VLVRLVLLLLLAVGMAHAAQPPVPKGVRQNPDQTVSVSLESADLRAVVTALARTHNINLVGSDKLSGKVTLNLNNAPVLQALDIILKNAGFVLLSKDNGMYEVLSAAEAARLDQSQQASDVRAFLLKYADVENVAKLLVPHAVPDEKSVGTDLSSNRLIISGTPAQFEKVERIIEAVDQPLPQVSIQARIVEIFTDKADSLGIQVDQVFSTKLLSEGAGTAGIDLTQNPVAANTVNFALNSKHLDAALNALTQKEVAEVLSAPRVATGHGHEAEIRVVDQVPVITRQTRVVNEVTLTDETVTFKETGVTLTVTPRVLADNRIELLVEPAVLELTGWTDTDPPAPIIDTRSAKTQVTISNGRWLVIGGLMRYNERVLERGVPLLKDIPGLGWLFSTRYTLREKSNLVILMTATVLTDPMIAEETRRTEDAIRSHRKAHGMTGGPVPTPGENQAAMKGKD